MQLVVKNLTQRRGERMVIKELSFRLPSGAAIVLTGPNGAGKTTLLRTISGFLPPASGRVCLEPETTELSLAERCHFIGHLNGIKANLTVSENLQFWGEYLSAGAAAREAIEAAQEAFGIASLGNIPAQYLSAGQKRRVALARLLVASRPLWLLDEPTASLDAASAKLLANAVDSHTRLGGLAVIATHLPLGIARATEISLTPVREMA